MDWGGERENEWTVRWKNEINREKYVMGLPFMSTFCGGEKNEWSRERSSGKVRESERHEWGEIMG